jgi:threonine synthase
MQFYSTNNKSPLVTARDAVLQGLAVDGGLFMPVELPELGNTLISALSNLSFQEIAYTVAQKFLKEDIPDTDLHEIIKQAFTFSPKLVNLETTITILELFHGPTLAFKDFGARFMAQLMAYFVRGDNRPLTILVATSGDTGSAVASGFLGVNGIQVVLLYPSKKVSLLQEKQLTTMGGNITALEIDGTFDDCQDLVKKAFVDSDLLPALRLTSANSINISRLIPQSFYYFYAVGQLGDYKHAPIISVPSGNFGNLTAGLFAKKMGLPVGKFIAAINANDVFATYLENGIYKAKKSTKTLSNAMDVGNPSNFARIMALYRENLSSVRRDIWSKSYDDGQTIEAMKQVAEKYDYVMDPHGAVGFLGLSSYRQLMNRDDHGIILETAHPAKFNDIVEEVLGRPVDIPARLQTFLKRQKQAVALSNKYTDFKDYLFSRKN